MRYKKTSLLISILILSILGYSYFRSYMDQEQFLVAFDKVTTIILGELWRLVSSPTVFFVLTAALLIYSFRDEILQLFPAIKEIKAGAFSAIIDSSQIIRLASTESDNQQLSKELGTKKKQEDITGYLLSRLGRPTLEMLLAMNGKQYTPSELLEIMDQLHIGESYIEENVYKSLDATSKSLYRLGSLLVLIRVVFPAIFDETIDTDDADIGVTKTLKTGVVEKIRARLKDIELRQTVRKSNKYR